MSTSFEIYALEETSKKAELKSIHLQHLFSKAFHICIGPNIDGVDTFFVIRDTDVIHFQYSEPENLFISINCFELPKECITPNFGYYNDGQLILSCFHGGLCSFEINKSESQLIFSFKPCTSVLQSFPVYKDCFFRIETGPNIVVYHTKPFGLEYKRSYEEQNGSKLFYAFPFGQDAIIFCTQNSLKCVSTNSDTEIIFPGAFSFDPIVFHTAIAPSDVLVLTLKGAILRLQSDLKLSLVKPPENNNSILKIFNLDGNYLLLVNKCHDHIIFNINNKIQYTFFSSTIGLSNLLIYNANYSYESMQSHLQSTTFAPQIFSYVGNELIIYRQGIPLSLINEFDLPERATGLFSLTIDKKEFIIISFENWSKLFEIVKEGKNTFLNPSEVPFFEGGKTIGVAIFSKMVKDEKENKIFQILENENAALPFRNSTTRNRYPEKTSFIASTKCMNIRITEKNRLFFTGSLRRMNTGEVETSIHMDYELNFIATYLTVSPPDANEISEFFVIGAENKETKEFAIIFQTICEEENEREIIINEKYPYRICSIEFIEKTDDKPLGILIGLENGSLVVGEVNFEKREIEKKQIIQLGTSPCRIRVCKVQSKPLIFGLSTRMWLLEICSGKNLVKPHPFSSSSPSHMVTDSSGRIFLISGKTFGIYLISSRSKNNPDYSILRKQLPEPIQTIKIIDQPKMINNKCFRKYLTPLLLIVGQREIYLMDSTSPSSYVPIVKYENDIIMCANYSNRVAVSKSEKGSLTDYTYNSYLAISTIGHSLNSQNREHKYNAIYIYLIDLNSAKALFPNGDIRKNSSNNTVLNPYLAAEVQYRVTAISITNFTSSSYSKLGWKEPYVVAACLNNSILVYSASSRKLSLVAKIDQIGTRIASIYSCFENSKISIFVSDIQQSITLLYFDIFKNKIIPHSEEGAMRPVSTDLIPFIVEKMLWCGGDKLGNFFIFSLSSIIATVSSQITDNSNKKTDSNSSKSQVVKPKEPVPIRRRLWFPLNINVGDIITGVDRGCDYGHLPFPIWYSTIGGSIGCFLESSTLRKSYTLMHALELEISRLIFSLTNCDSMTFRNKYFQSMQICDLDVVDIFQKLSPQRKEYIFKELEKKSIPDFGPKPFSSIEEIEAEILTCSSFFWLWNQESC